MICLKCGAENHEEAYFCGICGAKIRDKYTDEMHYPTPHGGVMSEFCYFDIDHNPCVKEKACYMEINEYAADGTKIYTFTAHKKSVEEKTEQ